jgi:hypothetical protein
VNDIERRDRYFEKKLKHRPAQQASNHLSLPPQLNTLEQASKALPNDPMNIEDGDGMIFETEGDESAMSPGIELSLQKFEKIPEKQTSKLRYQKF